MYSGSISDVAAKNFKNESFRDIGSAYDLRSYLYWRKHCIDHIQNI
jgi:hypothetical protein